MKKLTCVIVADSCLFSLPAVLSIAPWAHKLIVLDVEMNPFGREYLKHILDRDETDYEWIHLAKGEVEQETLYKLAYDLTHTEYIMYSNSFCVYHAAFMHKVYDALEYKEGFDCIHARSTKMLDLDTEVELPESYEYVIHRKESFYIDGGFKYLNSAESPSVHDLKAVSYLDFRPMFTNMIVDEKHTKRFKRAFPAAIRSHIGMILKMLTSTHSGNAVLGGVVCPTHNKNSLARVLGLVPGSGLYRANSGGLEDLYLRSRLSRTDPVEVSG